MVRNSKIRGTIYYKDKDTWRSLSYKDYSGSFFVTGLTLGLLIGRLLQWLQD